jgi:hypothetical protein
MKTKAITEEEYLEFITNFDPFKTPLRVGQAFCNEFDINDDMELFYEVDDERAGKLIEKYVDM